jgi:hypothetical protein
MATPGSYPATGYSSDIVYKPGGSSMQMPTGPYKTPYASPTPGPMYAHTPKLSSKNNRHTPTGTPTDTPGSTVAPWKGGTAMPLPVWCPPGQTSDPVTGHCVDKADNHVCPPGHRLDPITGHCMVIPGVCPEGKKIDPTTGQCIFDVSGDGRTRPAWCKGDSYDPATGRCFDLAGNQLCPPGHRVNPKTGQCVFATGVCPKGQKVDPDSGQCISEGGGMPGPGKLVTVSRGSGMPQAQGTTPPSDVQGKIYRHLIGSNLKYQTAEGDIKETTIARNDLGNIEHVTFLGNNGWQLFVNPAFRVTFDATGDNILNQTQIYKP